jgi:ribosome biogenesis GTPase
MNNDGTICRIESKDVYVIDDKHRREIRCSMRGKFKKEFNLKKDKLFQTDIAVVGDRVIFSHNSDGTGVIHTIQKRGNYLSRKAPRIKGASYRGQRLEQIVASNIDNFFIISSFSQPTFNNKAIDRFLVTGESSHLNTVIVINKIDLDFDDELPPWSQLYEDIGYTVVNTSAISKIGIDNLRLLVRGKTNLFWGHSGVGKSSLLNALYSNLDLSIGEISTATQKGKHTTVTVSMLEPEPGTFIIDTPGIREIDPYGIRKEDLSHYFLEFKEFIPLCKYNSCTHNHEPDCGVINAVESGKISEIRYESYLRILETIEDDLYF